MFYAGDSLWDTERTARPRRLSWGPKTKINLHQTSALCALYGIGVATDHHGWRQTLTRKFSTNCAMFGFVQLATSILLALLPNCKMNSCDAPIVLASAQSHESGRVFPQAVLTGLTGFLISRELTSCAFTRLDKSQGGMLNGFLGARR